LTQYELLTKRLQDLLTMPRPEFLASTEERLMGMQLAALNEQLGPNEPDAASNQDEGDLQPRIARLQGVLKFILRTEYDERLNRFDRNLRGLQSSVDLLNAQYEAFVRVRQAAVHSYSGYEQPIGRLRTRVGDAQAGIERLMARQGHMLERVAIGELEVRQKRLERYHDQARYALADSYDRASRSQSQGE
jgi:chromosome segregation ATPase